ncbi:TPA: hypothetical protein KEU64_002310 [Proteus mirabilis]|nr:hypothetical protein [Proteus mirabilis]
MKNFRVTEYELNAQRHVLPLYMKDGNDGYLFSSTMTLVRFMDQPFCIFASHALPRSGDALAQIGLLTTDGGFLPISEIEVAHKICRDRDLVAVKTINYIDYKHYFNLDSLGSTTDFSENFGWIGFPKKKAVQAINKSKASSEKIKEYLTEGTDGLKKWNNANFLLIGVKQLSESEIEITGTFDNTNVEYEHEGFKETGYSLKGMSGGALFRGPMKINTDSPDLEDFYDFAGIGLEYTNNIVKGASKYAVKQLLSEVLAQPVGS